MKAKKKTGKKSFKRELKTSMTIAIKFTENDGRQDLWSVWAWDFCSCMYFYQKRKRLNSLSLSSLTCWRPTASKRFTSLRSNTFFPKIWGPKKLKEKLTTKSITATSTVLIKSWKKFSKTTMSLLQIKGDLELIICCKKDTSFLIQSLLWLFLAYWFQPVKKGQATLEEKEQGEWMRCKKSTRSSKWLEMLKWSLGMLQAYMKWKEKSNRWLIF